MAKKNAGKGKNTKKVPAKQSGKNMPVTTSGPFGLSLPTPGNLPEKCREHRSYTGSTAPRKTAKYPQGCPVCWEYYRGIQSMPETYLDLGIRSLKKGKRFKKPADLAKLGLEFLEWCQKNGTVATKSLFAVFCGVCLDTMNRYRTGERDVAEEVNPTHSEVIKRIDAVIIGGIENLALTTKSNSTGPIAWLNNCAGWSDGKHGGKVSVGVQVILADYSDGKPYQKKISNERDLAIAGEVIEQGENTPIVTPALPEPMVEGNVPEILRPSAEKSGISRDIIRVRARAREARRKRARAKAKVK